MSTPDQRSPLVEAQSLLDEHGSWMAAAGAYWESDDISVLVQPASFDDPMDPRTSAGTVDVVFTVVSASQPLAFGGMTLELESPTGMARTATLNSRGQATLRELPAGTWRARLAEPGTAGSGEAVGGSTIARRSIFRRMAAAAGEPGQPVSATLASDDGLIHAEFVETDEGRLEVTLTTATAREPLPMARLTWVSEMVGEAHENVLVTPFALSPEGGTFIAKYDVGSLSGVEQCHSSRLTWADPSELTGELIYGAFRFSPFHSAYRGWERLAESGCCTGEAQAALSDVLG